MSNGFVELLGQAVMEAKNITGFRKGKETLMMKNPLVFANFESLRSCGFPGTERKLCPQDGFCIVSCFGLFIQNCQRRFMGDLI